jgi:hypothetical protein
MHIQRKSTTTAGASYTQPAIRQYQHTQRIHTWLVQPHVTWLNLHAMGCHHKHQRSS